MKCCYIDCSNETINEKVCCEAHRYEYKTSEHKKKLTVKEIQQKLNDQTWRNNHKSV